MSDRTPAETALTRRRMSWVVLAAFAAVGILAISIACGKKTEAPSAAAPSTGTAAPEGAAAAPTVPAPSEEAPSFKETAASGEAPYGAVQAPFDGAVDERGRLWVLDSANGRLRVFDARGGYLGGWGGNVEKGKYSYHTPEGIAIAGNNVYIADTWGGRVRSYTLTGEPVGSASGLYGPRGIAAGDGAVWVTDTGNARVVKYDTDLKNPKEIGKQGTAPGQFNGPVGIAVGAGGPVFVGDSANGRIQALSKDGQPVGSWSLPWLKQSWQAHLAADQRGTVYVSYPDGSRVLSFSKAGKEQKSWIADDAGTKFIRPVGVVVDRKADILYVMDVALHKVLKIGLAGAAAR